MSVFRLSAMREEVCFVEITDIIWPSKDRVFSFKEFGGSFSPTFSEMYSTNTNSRPVLLQAASKVRH